MKQSERVLRELMAGRIVTTRSAMLELGISQVASPIKELRDAGYPVKDRWVRNSVNRWGEKVPGYKEYYMEPGTQLKLIGV